MSTTLPPRAMTAERPSGLRLVVYPRVGSIESRFLARGSLDIGRDSTNGLCLDDGRVSKAHAQIRRRRDTGEFVLTDQGSSNGTFVDGAPVRARALDNGSVIRWGDTLAVAELGPSLGPGDDPTRALASTFLEEEVVLATAAFGSVLLLGPPGSGKSYLAAQIAERSPRRGPFVAVNCAAIPAELAESELFGHVKGAFTGAASDKVGLIRSAHGGTVFLDEIGATTVQFQAKLLTCIEERAVRPVGATRSQQVDVRFISATNLDISAAIDDGAFREDLSWRLSDITIDVPPVCRRRADIIPLLCSAAGLADHRDLTAEALEALLVHDWPGNVREVLQVAQRIGATPTRPVDYHVLPAPLAERLRTRPSLEPEAAPRGAPPRDALAAELEASGGNIAELARRLGKHRTQIVRWLDAYGMRPKRFGAKKDGG